MAGKRVEKNWTWHLKAPRAALWPLVSDTERLNEALRLPPYRLRESTGEDGLHRRHGEYDKGGEVVRWEEPPFEWSEEHWWRWERLYESGPLERARGTLVLEPGPRGGTVATYTLVAEPRNAAGAMLARTGHLREAGKAFERILKMIDSHARKPQGDFYANLASTRASAARRKRSDAYKVPPGVAAPDRALAKQVLDWLAVAFESDLRDIRAKRVARALGIGESEAQVAMVIATEMDAVQRRFRLICPACRSVVREVALPRDLPPATACRRCGATAETNYAQSVEVVFAPHPSIYTPSPMVYCASGPGVSPRIASQQILDPHERRDLPATLAHGPHVLRTADARIRLDFDAGGGKGALVQVGDDWIKAETADSLVFENHGQQVTTAVVERADWPAEATSLGEWLTWQRCRDATPIGMLDLDNAQPAGTLSLVVISARGADETSACRRVALMQGGAVVEDTGAGILLVFARPARAAAAMDAALQSLPAARIGADHGPLWLIDGARYTGEARDRVGDLAGLAQEGVPNLSPAFKAASGA